jgi:hypothetical protein
MLFDPQVLPISARFSRARAGVSLLEVLIAIFVILIGLMSVAAMIPVARLEMVQAAKADRAAACGRAGLENIKTAGMLGMRMWCYYYYDFVASMGNWTSALGGTNADAIRSYVVDPLYYARQPRYAPPAATNECYKYVYVFPFRTEVVPNPSAPVVPYEFGNRRVTYYAGWPFDPVQQPMCWDQQYASHRPSTTPPTPDQTLEYNPGVIAERWFTWGDDLVFPVPDDPLARPKLNVDTFDDDSTNTTPKTTRDIRQVTGDYTWFFTVTPQIDRESFPTGLFYNYTHCKAYDVSVAVCYKRDFTPFGPLEQRADPDRPSQRGLKAEFLGSGIGGGDVVLKADTQCAIPGGTGGFNLKWLDVKENDWLMLSTGEIYPNPIATPSQDRISNIQGVVIRWYRVVAVGPVVYDDKKGDVRYVTLEGPDWVFKNTFITSGQEEPMEASVMAMDNIVGVYTTRVEYDQNQ